LASFTVVYDACLLYPASIRDLVVELGRTGLLRAKWTERIHSEWIGAILRQRPELVRSRLERAAELMNAAVDDCLVSGFESLEAGLTGLPDPNDRHVLAAAIHCGAQEIVTFNIRDFPDAFLCNIFLQRRGCHCAPARGFCFADAVPTRQPRERRFLKALIPNREEPTQTRRGSLARAASAMRLGPV
jgi:PIN domain